jgi:hypothetical protein
MKFGLDYILLKTMGLCFIKPNIFIYGFNIWNKTQPQIIPI